MTEQSKQGRPPFSTWLAEAVGRVALEASQCEDTLGELIVLGRGMNVTELDPDWWTSGERLAHAVSILDDPDATLTAKTYRDILKARHTIIHGLWIERPDACLNMMRSKSTKKDPTPPAYDVSFLWTEESLTEVARQFNNVERMAADAISRYMGLA